MIAAAALVPARDEEDTIAATVAALRRIPRVTDVLVVDDASRDRTAAEAVRSGARVLRLARSRGKAAAVRAGWRWIRAEAVLLLDADLGGSAARAGPLLEPVLAGRADMAIACFPRRPLRTGFGLARNLARWGVQALTGRLLEAPLSGQRAVRADRLAPPPWCPGWGLEVALDVMALRRGLRVVEVPLELEHRVTGRDLRGFVHRGRQLVDIARTLWLCVRVAGGERP